VTEVVERYRRNAEKCLQLGQNFKELEAKRALLVMANAWLMLAAQRQKYIDTTPGNEPPPPVNEPPPPFDDLPKPPPVNDRPPAKEPPLHLNAAKPDDPMQC
jgi:hypothetical protein